MSKCSYYKFMDKHYLVVAGVIFLIQVARYFIVAGSSYYYFWVFKKDKYRLRKIQSQEFDRSRIKVEIRNSVLFSLISALVFALPFLDALEPYSKIYRDPSAHSLIWFWLTVPALVLLQDTYFYWMHRAIHHPAVYSLVHKEHHESRDPSPFAAYSFHWTEGILEVAYFIPLLFLIPLHEGMLYAFGLVSLIFNINGHLGVDLFPESWKTNSVLKWLNTSTNHNHHHKYFKGNYGFYFIFWDHFMNTKTKLPTVKTGDRAA